MNKRISLLLVSVFGVVLGLVCPLPAVRSQVAGTSLINHRPGLPLPLASAPCPESTFSNLPLANQLERAEEELAVRQREFEIAWGKPMQPPSHIPDNYTPEKLRQQIFEKIPGVRWAEVDCSFWPCMGVVVYEDKGVPYEEIVRMVGGGVAPPSGYNLPKAVDDLQLLGFGFYEGQPDESEQQWMSLLYGRMVISHEDEISIVSSNEELAE